jgi:hypothetical protein
MKYENYDKIVVIMHQINKFNQQLDNLCSPDVWLKVNIRQHEGTLFTIGIGNESEHEFRDDADLMVQRIKGKIKNKIYALKKELEAL